MRKTALTIAGLGVFFWAMPLLPGMGRFGSLKPEYLSRLVRLPLPKAAATLQPVAQAPVRVASAAPVVEKFSDPFLIDDKGALTHFYDALDRVARKEPGSHALILHYGDSPVTADSITADARAGLQARFGDAGHGFVLLAKPWAWYGHRGIALRSDNWEIHPATQNRARDGMHGLGGVSFTGGKGAWSAISIPAGHRRVHVYYLAQPDGGAFAILSGGQDLGVVQTAAEAKQPAVASFDLPADATEVRCDVTDGRVRLFGWSFEKDQPGVIYSSLGLNGAQVQAMLRYFEPAQWAAEIREQHPDLIILNYGTNESVFPEYIDKQYPNELRQVMERIEKAAGGASLLLMSPMDRGVRDGSGTIVTPDILPKIVAIQKAAAMERGWAFLDTYDAMGGAGTMAKWYEATPRLVSADFIHPLPAGAAKVGKLEVDALMRGYESRRGEQNLARVTH